MTAPKLTAPELLRAGCALNVATICKLIGDMFQALHWYDHLGRFEWSGIRYDQIEIVELADGCAAAWAEADRMEGR